MRTISFHSQAQIHQYLDRAAARDSGNTDNDASVGDAGDATVVEKEKEEICLNLDFDPPQAPILIPPPAAGASQGEDTTSYETRAFLNYRAQNPTNGRRRTYEINLEDVNRLIGRLAQNYRIAELNMNKLDFGLVYSYYGAARYHRWGQLLKVGHDVKIITVTNCEILFNDWVRLTVPRLTNLEIFKIDGFTGMPSILDSLTMILQQCPKLKSLEMGNDFCLDGEVTEFCRALQQATNLERLTCRCKSSQQIMSTHDLHQMTRSLSFISLRELHLSIMKTTSLIPLATWLSTDANLTHLQIQSESYRIMLPLWNTNHNSSKGAVGIQEEIQAFLAILQSQNFTLEHLELECRTVPPQENDGEELRNLFRHNPPDRVRSNMPDHILWTLLPNHTMMLDRWIKGLSASMPSTDDENNRKEVEEVMDQLVQIWYLVKLNRLGRRRFCIDDDNTVPRAEWIAKVMEHCNDPSVTMYFMLLNPSIYFVASGK